MIEFKKARPADAETLAGISQRAFDNDIHYGAPSAGGPPGYKAPEWQRTMIKIGDYYKILSDGAIIGGIVVLRKAPREYDLGRIFIEPAHQNQGIGTQAIEFLWQEYPMAKRWTLGTPAWNARTRHFYAKMDFREIGQDQHGGILLEKLIQATGWKES